MVGAKDTITTNNILPRRTCLPFQHSAEQLDVKGLAQGRIQTHDLPTRPPPPIAITFTTTGIPYQAPTTCVFDFVCCVPFDFHELYKI